jgi:hypothetical protein
VVDFRFAEAPELPDSPARDSTPARHLLHGLGMKTEQFANFVAIDEGLELVVHRNSPGFGGTARA